MRKSLILHFIRVLSVFYPCFIRVLSVFHPWLNWLRPKAALGHPWFQK